MAWQLYRAKQYNRFKQTILVELKPKMIKQLALELDETRSELFPNTDCQLQAATYYWSQYPSRILQRSLEKEIVTKQWLKDTGNYRNCQHLFHVERERMHHSRCES